MVAPVVTSFKKCLSPRAYLFPPHQRVDVQMQDGGDGVARGRAEHQRTCSRRGCGRGSPRRRKCGGNVEE